MRRRPIAERVGVMVAELAILGAVYYFIVREPSLILGLGVTILAANLVPPRFEGIAGGLGLAGTALWVHLATGARQIPGLLGAIGVIVFVYALIRLIAAGRAASPDDRG